MMAKKTSYLFCPAHCGAKTLANLNETLALSQRITDWLAWPTNVIYLCARVGVEGMRITANRKTA